jgi:stearoyl-CoA desaturase (delta-9 desaturase)
MKEALIHVPSPRPRTQPATLLSLRTLRWDALIANVCLYALCLGAFFIRCDRAILSLFIVSYLARMFGLTICYHRYFAHRSFKTSRPFQFILALIGSLNLQGGVIWWAETHRYHHRHADTPDDLHSPSFQGFLYSHYGWFLNKDNQLTHLDRIKDLARFPELVWLNTYHWVLYVVFAAIIAWVFGFAGVVWGVCIPTVLLWEMTHWVQSFSHSLGGYRRWTDSPDQSRNHWLLALITLGEFHNNHHAFASSAKQGHVWWEIDGGYYILKALAALGLVWELRVPSSMTKGAEASQ